MDRLQVVNEKDCEEMIPIFFTAFFYIKGRISNGQSPVCMSFLVETLQRVSKSAEVGPYPAAYKYLHFR